MATILFRDFKNNRSQTFSLSQTSSEIIALCAKTWNLSPDFFYLTIHGYTLEQNKLPLSEYITDGAVLHLKLRLRGGSDLPTDQGNASQAEINRPTSSMASSGASQSNHGPNFFLDQNGSPSAWFFVFERSIRARNIVTHQDRFDQLILSLPPELLSKLAHTLESMATEEDPFSLLKEAIMQNYREPKANIFSHYFKAQVLGSQRPSEFLKKALNDLETLQSGITNDDAILRHFFLSALPSQSQAILAVSGSTNLRDLAKMADKIAEVSKPRDSFHCSNINETSPSATAARQNSIAYHSDTTQSQSDALICAIEGLTRRLTVLERSRSPHSGRKTTGSRSSSSDSRNLICTFHRKYKNNANFCLIGCTWQHRADKCQLLDLCYYHHKFRNLAKRCLDGCRYKNSVSDQTVVPKN